MDISGEYTIAASRQQVWDALNDPDILRQCIAGCEELDKVSDTEFTAKVTAKVGPVKAKFAGKVMLSDIDAPNSYTISGEGQGGVAGFAKGSAKVALAASAGGDGETVLTYVAKAEVGGKLASIGSRLVLGVAKKTADDFFGKFSEIVGETAAAEAVPEAVAPGVEEAPAPAESQTRIWIIGGAVILVLIAI